MSLTFQSIPIQELKEHPDNPRKTFDPIKLTELTDSVRALGILNPLLVRPNGHGFEILGGARRFRASQLAGLEEVPAIVRELDDAAALELVVVDNLQRDDLHPLEEATSWASTRPPRPWDGARREDPRPRAGSRGTS